MPEVWIKILEIVAAPLTLILGALAAVWVQVIQIKGNQLIAAKLGVKRDEFAHANDICATACSAAEQLFKAGKIVDRQAYASEMAKQERDADHLSTTDAFIDHYIEGKVWDNFSAPGITAKSDMESSDASGISGATNNNTSTPPTEALG